MSSTMSVGLGITLMVGGAAWLFSDDYQFVTRAIVFAIALLAALSSARTDRSAWVFGLALIAVLLVTVFPTVMPRTVMLWAIAGCLSAIGACLMVLQQVVPTPRAAQVVPAEGRLP